MNDPFKSPKFLAWVRRQDCMSCGHPGPVDPHHIKHTGGFSGVGMRAPDWFSMPQCNAGQRDCHGKMHADPERWQEQPLMVLQMLHRALDQGVIRIEYIGD